MSKCIEITHREYQEYLKNMNFMNLLVLEEINTNLTGKNGEYDDTHPDKIVSPKCEVHDEYFKEKRSFVIDLCMTVIKKVGPTSELECILNLMSCSEDMIELIWAAMQLQTVLEA